MAGSNIYYIWLRNLELNVRQQKHEYHRIKRRYPIECTGGVSIITFITDAQYRNIAKPNNLSVFCLYKYAYGPGLEQQQTCDSVKQTLHVYMSKKSNKNLIII